MNINDSLEDITTVLVCDGDLILTTIRESSEQLDYQWRFLTDQPSRLAQTVSASFLDGVAQMLNFSSSTSGVASASCTIEEFIAASQLVQVGDSVNDPSELFNCGWRTEYFSSDGNEEKTVYDWIDGRPYPQVFTTPNRKLSVEVRNRVVTKVELSRF